MTKKSAKEVMPVRSSTVRWVAFLDSAARTAISQEGEPVWSSEVSCGSALVRRYSCPYRTTAGSETLAETTQSSMPVLLNLCLFARCDDSSPAWGRRSVFVVRLAPGRPQKRWSAPRSSEAATKPAPHYSNTGVCGGAALCHNVALPPEYVAALLNPRTKLW